MQLVWFMFTAFIVWLIANFYIFILLPRQIKREVYSHPLYIQQDYDNLISAIRRANDLDQLELCAYAIKLFKNRDEILNECKVKMEDLRKAYYTKKTLLNELNLN
jgi:5-bromo-4-chloroindolyl phosphate hydrolysis protein